MINKKQTFGNLEIKSFVILEKPIQRGFLEPFIYKGLVKTTDLGIIEILWDKFGRCSNYIRQDCFLIIN